MQHHQVEGIPLLPAAGQQVGHIGLHRHADIGIRHADKMIEMLAAGVNRHVDALHGRHQVCFARRTMEGSMLLTSGEAVMAMA